MENLVTLYCYTCPYVVYMYIFVPYVHNPESAKKILRTQLKKRNGHLGKPVIDTLDSSMMKKMAADSNTIGKTWIYLQPAWLCVDYGQGGQKLRCLKQPFFLMLTHMDENFVVK